MSSSSVCPFGPRLETYWKRRYEFFSRFDEGILIDAEGLYSVKPEDSALRTAQRFRSQRILDAFGGVGGSAIGLARAGKSVVCVERDPERLRMARHNATLYGVADRIEFLEGDVTHLWDRIAVEGVNYDPPWGGPEYRQIENFPLEGFAPDGRLLVDQAQRRGWEMAITVPFNLDVERFRAWGRDLDVMIEERDGRVLYQTVFIDFRPDAPSAAKDQSPPEGERA
jgi:trimethylguanosine synthase